MQIDMCVYIYIYIHRILLDRGTPTRKENHMHTNMLLLQYVTILYSHNAIVVSALSLSLLLLLSLLLSPTRKKHAQSGGLADMAAMVQADQSADRDSPLMCKEG